MSTRRLSQPPQTSWFANWDAHFGAAPRAIISLTELAVLVSALLAIGGRRVPAEVIWSGFAANLLLSLLALVYALFVEFSCCGLL